MTKPQSKKTNAKSTVPVKKRRMPRTLDEWVFWMRRKGSHILMSALRYALILCIGQIILLPILQMISKTFMSPYEVGNPVSTWIPSQFSVEHLIVAFKLLNYPKALLYTLGTTALQVVLQVLSAAVTGYSFARIRSKKIQMLFFVVLLTIVVPPSVLMLPQYLFFRDFDVFGIIMLITGSGINLLGKPVTLYILDICGMGLKSGLYIFIFRQFFRGLPKELEEAAHMDGYGFVGTLFRIIMPNAVPGIITVSVLSFVWNWSDTYFANLFVNNKSNLMVKLMSVSGDMENSLWGIHFGIPDTYYFGHSDVLYQASVLTSASLLVIFPLIVLYMIIQKRFVESASNAGIVG